MAYVDGRPCFLDEPHWDPIIWHDITPNTFDHALCSLFAVNVKGPGLVHDARLALLRGLPVQSIKQQALDLKAQAQKTFQYFNKILTQVSRAPAEVSNPDGAFPSSIYSFQGVHGADVLTPRDFCSHHSLIITINHVLLELGGCNSEIKANLNEESRVSAVEICKSLPAVEKMPVTILGIFSLSYPSFFVERALSACPEEYKMWIERKRRRWSSQDFTHVESQLSASI